MLLNYVVPMIITVVLSIALVVILTIKLKDANEKQKLLPIKIIFYILLALEFLKIFHLIARDGAYYPNRYPIVFCGMVFITFPIICFKPQSKFSTVAKSFSAIPGFVIFLLFAIFNTDLPLNMMQCHSYLFHGLMLVVSIYLFTSGLYHIDFKNVFPLFACLAGYVVASTFISLFIGGDLSYFGPNSGQLGFVYDMFGYAVGNCLVIMLLFILTAGIYGIVSLCTKKKAVEFNAGGNANA